MLSGKEPGANEGVANSEFIFSQKLLPDLAEIVLFLKFSLNSPVSPAAGSININPLQEVKRDSTVNEVIRNVRPTIIQILTVPSGTLFFEISRLIILKI